MEYWAQIMEAAKAPGGIVALIILAIMTIAVIYFPKESVAVKLGVFGVILIAAGFLLAPLLPDRGVTATEAKDVVVDLGQATGEDFGDKSGEEIGK